MFPFLSEKRKTDLGVNRMPNLIIRNIEDQSRGYKVSAHCVWVLELFNIYILVPNNLDVLSDAPRNIVQYCTNTRYCRRCSVYTAGAYVHTGIHFLLELYFLTLVRANLQTRRPPLVWTIIAKGTAVVRPTQAGSSHRYASDLSSLRKAVETTHCGCPLYLSGRR